MEWKAKIVNNEPIARLVARENVNCALESRNFLPMHIRTKPTLRSETNIEFEVWLIDSATVIKTFLPFFDFLGSQFESGRARIWHWSQLVLIPIYISVFKFPSIHTRRMYVFLRFCCKLSESGHRRYLDSVTAWNDIDHSLRGSKLPARCQQWLISYHTPPRLVRQIQTICRVGESWRALAYFCSGPA